MMNFEQFIDVIKNEVKGIVGEQYTVSVNCVLKINRERQGLSILGGGSDTYPSIYLEDFYEDYKSGKGIHEIAAEIVNITRSRKSTFNIHSLEIRDFNMVKPKLRAKLINYQKNEKLLATVPFEKYLDLAVVPYIQFTNDGGIMTTRVVYSLLETWGVTAEEVLQQAKDNTLIDTPVVTNRMSDFIFDIMLKEMKENDEDEMLLRRLYEEDRSTSEMFILTNVPNINGAFAAFHSDSLLNLADRIGSELLYILPSSVHEILAISAKGIEARKLREMVMEVNSTQVAAEDYLSDSVYLYSRETDRVSIVA